MKTIIPPFDIALIPPFDHAEGFSDYFSNIGPDLASKIDTPNLNFQTYVEKANLKNQSSVHSSQSLSVMSTISCMVFLATKPLVVLIRYLVKLLK
jgi:hypothetical protein